MTIRRGAVLEVIAVALALAAALAPIPAPVVERWFSAGVYPPLQRALTPVTNLVPFAVLDPLSLAALLGVIAMIVAGVRASWRVRRLAPAMRTAGHLVAAVACGYLAFLLLWGFNYRRVPMRERLVLERSAPSNDAVVKLGLDAVERLNSLYADAHRTGWQGDEWRNGSLRQAFDTVQPMLSDAPRAAPGRLKRSLYGAYFRWASVDGMVNPFGLEVLANPDLLPFERPFVAAHEWSHLAGYADESEANFIGWLTCIRADAPAQYSGWLFLFWQVNGEVGEAGRKRLGEALAPGPRADLAAIIARLRRAQVPWLRAAGWAVYDQYLKANRVEGGVRSYGAVVTLILEARFQEGWTPVRRGTDAPARPDGS